MEYGRIIRRALEIIWRHKVLWVFGALAALFGGSRGGGGGGGQGLQYTFGALDWRRFQQTPFGPGMGAPFAPWLSPNWDNFVAALLGILALLVVIGLVFVIIGIIVRYTSLGAMIGMVEEVEEREQTSLRSGWRRGWSRFLRLFAIDLIIGLVMIGVMLIFILLVVLGVALVVGPAIWIAESQRGMMVLAIIWGIVVGLVMLLLLILLALALSAIVTLVREYAFRASVLEGRGVFEALGDGIALLRSRFRESVLMWLLLLAINIALSLVLAIPFGLLAAGLLIGPALAVWSASQSAGAAILTALPFLLFIILVAIIIGGIYLAFESSVWTLTYRELRGRQVLTPTVPPETL